MSTSLQLSGRYWMLAGSTHIALRTQPHLSHWLEPSHILVLNFPDAASLADTGFRQPCCSFGTYYPSPPPRQPEVWSNFGFCFRPSYSQKLLANRFIESADSFVQQRLLIHEPHIRELEANDPIALEYKHRVRAEHLGRHSRRTHRLTQQVLRARWQGEGPGELPNVPGDVEEAHGQLQVNRPHRRPS